ncbi:MAG: IPT/TIG domain-containing protein [Candidatus Dormibacteraeota bacterium]|nr:IPT/TIG domain-containing protein [Candidatus Dormibacteraeota bacterium]
MTATRRTAASVVACVLVACAIGTQGVAVAANPGFSLAGPSTVTAGSAFALTVTGVDSSGHLNPAYAGTVHFTSTDPSAQVALPADYTFSAGTSGDDGSHTFTGIVLRTAGSTTVTVTDTGNSALTGSTSVLVNAGPVSQLVLTTPTFSRVHSTFGGTVAAKDSSANVVHSYTGTVVFTSSDSLATLPSSYTFVSGDSGSHAFSFTLNSLGSQTITATDTGHSLHATNPVIVSGPASQLVVLVNPPSNAPVATHTAMSLKVTAEDVSGNQDPGYTGTVGFTSSDGSATLPANYSFTANDGGAHTFTNGVTLRTVGSQSVTATDQANATIAGSGGITVNPATATTLVVSLPASVSDGASFTLSVTARDAYGDTATGYRGTVHLTSSDLTATLPADYTFVPGDTGAHSFSNGAKLKTTGSQSITATDTVTSSIMGSASTNVAAGGPAVSLLVSAPAGISGGQSFSFTVTAQDVSGATSTGYVGTVHFTSTDATASLPANYTFGSADKGFHVFTATLNDSTAAQTITATDTVISTIHGTSAPVAVAGPAAKFSVAAPSTATAGVPVIVSVTAEDASGKLATNYTGTVHITTTDSAAVLPANHTFTSGDCGVAGPGNLDCGVRQFTVTFHTAAGPFTVTATDTLAGTVNGTSASVAVSAGPAAKLLFSSAPLSATAGSTFGVTVKAEDSFNNTATGYAGTVTFTASDTAAAVVLPADYTFVPGDAGQHAFSGLSFVSAGTRTLTAADKNDPGAIIAAATTVTVNPAGASTLVVAAPHEVTASSPFSLRVSAYDPYGNVAMGYRGTVTFTSSDPAAALPGNYVYTAGDSGVHAFSATLNTPGSSARSVTATDTVSSSITGAASIQVAGATSSLTVQLSATTSAIGAPLTATVSAFDPFGNPAIGYAGTVHFTSSDAQAALPADYTFTTNSSCGQNVQPTADCGTHVFSVTFNGAGTQSVTATDTVAPALQGSAQAVIQQPVPAVTQISPAAGPIAGGQAVTITGSQFRDAAGSYLTSDVMVGSDDVPSANAYPCAASCFQANAAGTSIMLVTPASSSGQVHITVKTESTDATVSQTSTAGPADLYTYVPKPTVTSLSQSYGPAAGGNTITINGTNFSGAGYSAISVNFTSAQVTPSSVTPTSLTVAVPQGVAGSTVSVFVTTPGGDSSQSPADYYTYLTSRYAVSSTNQYFLHGSDGSTWSPIDQTNLSVTFTPKVDSTVQLLGNADLWTGAAGFNQDIGVELTPNGGPPTLVTWKESGGSAGTFSPNAATVQGTTPVTANTQYTATLVWKTNTPMPSSDFIAAGAGSPGHFSPTTLTALLYPDTGSTDSILQSSVSTRQYTLTASGGDDGTAWRDVDATGLRLSITPQSNATVVLTGNADLWTSTTGVNQDLGIDVSPACGNTSASPASWKESGGYGGTFSPNAAYVQLRCTMTGGVTYTVKLRWRSNHAMASGQQIWIGAGSAPTFSPSSLDASVVPNSPTPPLGVASSTQYTLTGTSSDDGTGWRAVDGNLLSFAVTPSATCLAHISANADMWTSAAGVNQDLGIEVTLLGQAGVLAAWKESGGFAGTFSPNAASVQTTYAMTAGTTYMVTLQWRSNRPLPPGGAIWIGAGGGANFSPTSLNVDLDC